MFGQKIPLPVIKTGVFLAYPNFLQGRHLFRAAFLLRPSPIPVNAAQAVLQRRSIRYRLVGHQLSNRRTNERVAEIRYVYRGLARYRDCNYSFVHTEHANLGFFN